MNWRVCIYGEVLTRQGLGPAVAVGASETVRCRWLYATTCPGLQFVNLLQSLQPNYTTITVPLQLEAGRAAMRALPNASPERRRRALLEYVEHDESCSFLCQHVGLPFDVARH